MRDLLRQLFRIRPANTKSDAKQRLKVLLVHDEVNLTPAQLEKMRGELLEVLGRYVEVDADAVDVHLERSAGSVTLVSNVPVRRNMGRRVAGGSA